MKKVIIGILAIMLVFPIWVLADSTMTETEYRYPQEDRRIIKLVWVADQYSAGVSEYAVATAASVPSVDGWYLDYMFTDPGGTAPTANYDIYLYDTKGDNIKYDILNANGENRSATASEVALPYFNDGVYGSYPIASGVSVVISNNAVKSATASIFLYLYK